MQLIQSGTADTGSGEVGATLSVTFSSTPALGSMLLLAVAAGTGQLTAPSGWNVSRTNTSFYGIVQLWYKAADGTSANTTVTVGSGNTAAIAWYEYSYGRPFAPDVNATVNSGGLTASGPYTTGSTGTTSTSLYTHDMCMAVYCLRNFSTAPTSVSHSNGYTQRHQVSTTGSTVANRVCLITADNYTTSIGTQSTTATWTNSVAGYAASLAGFEEGPTTATNESANLVGPTVARTVVPSVYLPYTPRTAGQLWPR